LLRLSGDKFLYGLSEGASEASEVILLPQVVIAITGNCYTGWGQASVSDGGRLFCYTSAMLVLVGASLKKSIGWCFFRGLSL
jgi:hypothetical protein